MKQFTFSAQVANNLLTVLQGYSKTIRLLLVMFLTLTVTTNAWAADVTCDFTAKSASHTSYTDSWSYGGFTVFGGANNNGDWAYVKMGGKETNLANANPVYIASPQMTSSISKVQVSIIAGSLAKSDMSVNDWGVYVYSDANMTNQVNYVAGGAITNNAAVFEFTPTSGTTWSANNYYKVSFNLTNTTTTNGIIWLDKITFVESAGGGETPDPCTTPAVAWNTKPANGEVGGSMTASVTTNYSNGLTYSSSNQTVATVTNAGVINYLSAGTTTITATVTGDGTTICEGPVSVQQEITVTAPAGGGDGEGECSWTLVTDVSTLKADDEVIITASGENACALSTNQKSNNRGATAITKNGNTLTSPSADVQILALKAGSTSGTWAFYTGTSGYLYAASSSGNQLKTKTTLDEHGSWTISITDGVASIAAKGSSNRNVMQYNYNNGSPLFACYASASQTSLAIYKKVCTTEPSQLETPDDLDATDITSTSAILYWTAVANADGYRVTINGKTIDTGSTTYTATELTANTSYTWTVTAIGNGTTYSDSETASHTFTTLAAASDPYTVTFDAGSGTCTTTSLTEASGGAGVTLPTASPSDACTEEGWTFAGWAEASVATETTTAPTTLLAAGDTYNPTADCPLYAVYSITETGSGGSGDYELVTSAPTDWSGTYLIVNTDDKKAWKGSATSDNNAIDVTITDNTIVSEATTDAETFTIAIMEGGYSICGTSGKYISGTSGDNTTNYGTSAALNTISIDEDNNVTITSNTSVLRQNNANSSLFRYYKSSTYSSQHPIQLYRKSAGSSTTYYHSTPSCVPTYSITYDFAGGTGSHCSNTSVPQGDSYTICDEAPTKEGHTFLGWSYGTELLQAGATITPTTDTTLTAQWQIKTYTVTWSNNGVTTPVTYEHGDDLTLPSAPASCDGVKEFVGWTEDNTFTYHATTPPTDLFKTTTATVTADKTYYAVFATPPGTGGGGSGSDTTTTLDFTAQGYADATAISNLTVDGVTATFAKGSNGSNAPKYYTNGTAIRAYGGNTITLSANQITAATFTFGSDDGSNGITADCGSWDSPTWTGDATDEVVFTISGSSGNRRIQSIAVTYTSGGGSGSYSDYTTICQQIESIEVQSPQTEFYLTDDFTIGSGKVIATLSGGGTTDVTGDAHFSGYNMEVVGTYTVTVTYMGATATYNINVQPLDNAWVLTWNVSGKTNTGLGPRSVTKGSAIGTLPVPEVPAACAGKTFMGWTESNIVPSDGVGIVYITPETKPADNTTYYAVFATVNNFCTQKPIDQIASGSKVVIVAVASLTDDGGAGKAISSRATDDTYNLQGDDVAIYDQTINTPHSTCIWTLQKDDEDNYIFTQDGNYLNGIDNGSKKRYCQCLPTSDSWKLTLIEGKEMTYYMQSNNSSTYVEWYTFADTDVSCFTTYTTYNENGDFDMQFFVTANADGADITDYTTGCAEYTITYYGFTGGYSTSCSSDGTIILPVNSIHTVPNCGDVVKDHTNLNREFTGKWMTQPHGGHTFLPGETFVLTQDTTLYAQWTLETTSDVTLPTDIEDLAGTDVLVYGDKTLTIQPGTTTINSLTLKGGLQTDGSYSMPNIWVPAGATLVRNSNKIYLDLAINANNYYPFAVPFAAKNNANVEYLDPTLAAVSTYGTHFAIKTYDGARRAEVGEDKANNWVRVLRDETLQPGVGYIITAMTYPDKDTATIRIPMTVPNTWFDNGEQAIVGTTDRTAMAVTAHTGTAATEHQRHAGWNFVANPYLTNFAGGNVVSENGLDYINGELVIQGSYEYLGEDVPYVTVPAYDFAYYTAHKLSDIKLSPEYSFFVQVGTSGTMNFTTAGRQQAPAGIAARNAEEQPIKMDVDITLSDNHNSDHTGIIICDRYSNAYEVGRDLEKMFGSAYNLTVYTLMEDNTPLAYHALAINSSMQVIPVGYRAPEQGEYTFALKESTSSIDLLNEQYEQLILVDYQTGELTNLLYTNYTFYSERTQSNSRFAIYAVPRQNAPTDLPNAIGNKQEVRKVIYNDHLYILRDGNVYNGMGQKM